jgi:hypothetical protein
MGYPKTEDKVISCETCVHFEPTDKLSNVKQKCWDCSANQSLPLWEQKEETLRLNPLEYAALHQGNALDNQVGGDHYSKLKIQPMQYSMANKLDACQHTAIKYITRFRDKGTPVADLDKAIHCLEMLKQFESDGDTHGNH